MLACHHASRVPGPIGCDEWNRARRQSCQGVVVRKPANRFLIAFAMGDIEVSGDVTAVTQRRAANLDVFSISQLSFVDIGRSVSSHFEPRVDLLLDVACAVFSTIGVETIKSFARQRAILEQLASGSPSTAFAFRCREFGDDPCRTPRCHPGNFQQFPAGEPCVLVIRYGASPPR